MSARRILILAVASLAGLTLSACAARQPVGPSTAATAPVIHDEIPEIEFPQSLYPASVGVLDARRPPLLADDLPTFEPVELTEEERKIVEGDEPGRKIDFLALYPGATPESRGPDIAGPDAGVLTETPTRYGNGSFHGDRTFVYGHMGPSVGINTPRELAAHDRLPRESPAGVYGAENFAVGEIPAEQRYGHHRDVERD